MQNEKNKKSDLIEDIKAKIAYNVDSGNGVKESQQEDDNKPIEKEID